MKRIRIPPPPLFIACAALMGCLPPVYVFSVSVWWVFIILLLAAGIAVAGLGQFYHRGTTVSPISLEKSSVLVTNGVYALSRNPMYLSLLLILIAWFLWLGALSAVIGLPLFVLLMNYLQIKPEENMLNNLFGEAYRAYCRKVRRWL
ncbi:MULTISPECIES: methyltransferase family protein [Pasteurellaceae]|uniref:methyltransferase family protein n=1 Tax=Pasteurellaceae TaxID=712 RepID=UPI003563A400